MHARLFLISPLVLAVSCGERDCAKISVVDERDWCLHERAVARAQRGTLDLALSDLGAIQAPMVKAFATEKILTTAPAGISHQQAESLCKSLSEPYASSCLRTWSRPHLWEGS